MTELKPKFPASVEKFQVVDVDESGDPSYYGFVNKDGNWYIMKATSSTGAYRYCAGSSDYSTNWTGRAALTYGYPNQTF